MGGTASEDVAALGAEVASETFCWVDVVSAPEPNTGGAFAVCVAVVAVTTVVVGVASHSHGRGFS